VSDTRALSQALVATGFHPRDRTGADHDNRATFARVLGQVQGIRRCGSAALDLCLTADGTYDAYWERTLSLWDTAAGAAIAMSAGARVTALDGGPVDLSVGHLLVSNGHLHDPLQPLVAPTADAAPAPPPPAS
jgi:myo-inositol-1(or 4)-monophosphatase